MLLEQWDDPGAKPALSRQVYLAERCEGDRVNLETDEFQKYLQQIADLVYTVYCVANAAVSVGKTKALSFKNHSGTMPIPTQAIKLGMNS